MNTTWLEKYPKAFALLQQADDGEQADSDLGCAPGPWTFRQHQYYSVEKGRMLFRLEAERFGEIFHIDYAGPEHEEQARTTLLAHLATLI